MSFLTRLYLFVFIGIFVGKFEILPNELIAVGIEQEKVVDLIELCFKSRRFLDIDVFDDRSAGQAHLKYLRFTH